MQHLTAGEKCCRRSSGVRRRSVYVLANARRNAQPAHCYNAKTSLKLNFTHGLHPSIKRWRYQRQRAQNQCFEASSWRCRARSFFLKIWRRSALWNFNHIPFCRWVIMLKTYHHDSSFEPGLGPTHSRLHAIPSKPLPPSPVRVLKRTNCYYIQDLH